jgi:hypothetical protein
MFGPHFVPVGSARAGDLGFWASVVVAGDLDGGTWRRAQSSWLSVDLFWFGAVALVGSVGPLSDALQSD